MKLIRWILQWSRNRPSASQPQADEVQKTSRQTRGQGQKTGRFTGAETRGDGRRQVGSIPGKQSGKKCWRVRHGSEVSLAKSEWSEAAYILGLTGDDQQVKAVRLMRGVAEQQSRGGAKQTVTLPHERRNMFYRVFFGYNIGFM